MKMLLLHYLASLKERGELDALLPDLLRHMGLNVVSEPSIGTRQFGVDISAHGSLDEGPDSVYLLSVKSGNLTRNEWNGDSPQALRPSLDEIQDVYIPSHLPPEHAGKPVVIVICLGGIVAEATRPNLSQYTAARQSDRLKFVEWDGDRIATLLNTYMLNEHLVPAEYQSSFRKSLALITEPEASINHFNTSLELIYQSRQGTTKERAAIVQRSNLLLWSHFAWSREEGNLEASYRCAEWSVLRAWQLIKSDFTGTGPGRKPAVDAYIRLVNSFQQVTAGYIEKISKAIDTLYGLSSAVSSSNPVDVNMALFEVLGRCAVAGLWAHWISRNASQEEEQVSVVAQFSILISRLINNNPTLLTPYLDDQGIDIGLTLHLLGMHDDHYSLMSSYLEGLTSQITLAFAANGPYPTSGIAYSDLIGHPPPRTDDAEYLNRATQASTLIPVLAHWCAKLGRADLWGKLNELRVSTLPHATMQLWFPSSETDECLYDNHGPHGLALLSLDWEHGPEGYLDRINTECQATDCYANLSAIETGIMPLVLTACRHHRLPVPPQIVELYIPPPA